MEGTLLRHSGYNDNIDGLGIFLNTREDISKDWGNFTIHRTYKGGNVSEGISACSEAHPCYCNTLLHPHKHGNIMDKGNHNVPSIVNLKIIFTIYSTQQKLIRKWHRTFQILQFLSIGPIRMIDQFFKNINT